MRALLCVAAIAFPCAVMAADPPAFEPCDWLGASWGDQTPVRFAETNGFPRLAPIGQVNFAVNMAKKCGYEPHKVLFVADRTVLATGRAGPYTVFSATLRAYTGSYRFVVPVEFGDYRERQPIEGQYYRLDRFQTFKQPNGFDVEVPVLVPVR